MQLKKEKSTPLNITYAIGAQKLIKPGKTIFWHCVLLLDMHGKIMVMRLPNADALIGEREAFVKPTILVIRGF
ncbi:unnamed protein product [Hymenolepis diminuta]|uniref:Uncharacterized protein n=1 Tax=Hymenolepis diminuta TaxID=6216 RepID=A0A564Z630_HYMDI|nr:unnamed protein product [Hymenolepis diminuta]